jgi:hypothetical protein
MTTLEICQRIVDLDHERQELDNKLYMMTGKHFEEFMEQMGRLLAPAEPGR